MNSPSCATYQFVFHNNVGPAVASTSPILHSGAASAVLTPGRENTSQNLGQLSENRYVGAQCIVCCLV